MDVTLRCWVHKRIQQVESRALADLWNRKVVPAYLAQDWRAVLKAAEDVLGRSPEDPVAHVYAERSQLYLKKPPAKGWDGVTKFTEK